MTTKTLAAAFKKVMPLNLNPQQQLVLLLMIHLGAEDKFITIPHREVCELTGQSQRGIVRHFRDLTIKGILERKKNKRENGMTGANSYKIVGWKA